MKRIPKLTAILCLGALTNGAIAQGTVSFANGPTTLISLGVPGAGIPADWQPDNYFFGLLTSPSPAGPFTFTGIYATNTAGFPGKLGPATYIPTVPGWAEGTTMFYEVARWSSNLGLVWNNAWLVNNAPAPADSSVWTTPYALFGLSGFASGAAGGGLAPPFPLFGGTGLPGFDLNPVGIPEPSSMMLLGLGVGCLSVFRRGKEPELRPGMEHWEKRVITI
jgi:hypothetical protein